MLGWPEVLLILVVLLFVFGPKKLPQIARDLGKAWQEFKAASSNITNAIVPSESNASNKERDALIKLALNMGINTEGKTIEQLISEIEMKTESRGKTSI